VVLSIGRRLVGASRAISIAASVIVSIVRIVSVRMVVVGMVLLLLLLAILETLVVSMTLGALSLVVAAAVAVNQLVTAIVSTRVVVLLDLALALDPVDDDDPVLDARDRRALGALVVHSRSAQCRLPVGEFQFFSTTKQKQMMMMTTTTTS